MEYSWSHYLGKTYSTARLNLKYFQRGLRVMNEKLEGLIKALEEGRKEPR